MTCRAVRTVPMPAETLALWESLHTHPQVLLMNVSSCWMPGEDGPTVSVALLVQDATGQRHCYVPQVSGPDALATALRRAALFVPSPTTREET